MRQIFDRIKAECFVCKTPLNGEHLLKRGDRYYCQSDYDKTSAEEKAENKRIEEDNIFIKRILKPYQ